MISATGTRDLSNTRQPQSIVSRQEGSNLPAADTTTNKAMNFKSPFFISRLGARFQEISGLYGSMPS